VIDEDVLIHRMPLMLLLRHVTEPASTSAAAAAVTSSHTVRHTANLAKEKFDASRKYATAAPSPPVN